MRAELTYQPGYSKNEAAPLEQANRRNEASFKKVKSSAGELQTEVPRDRTEYYEPIIIEKHQRCFAGFKMVIGRIKIGKFVKIVD